MPIFRKACVVFFSILFLFSACTTPPAPNDSGTRTPRPKATQNASAKDTSIPAASSLEVEKEALRGMEVRVWYPWFDAEASLFESQIKEFNAGNEWGIVVSAEGKGNFRICCACRR